MHGCPTVLHWRCGSLAHLVPYFFQAPCCACAEHHPAQPAGRLLRLPGLVRAALARHLLLLLLSSTAKPPGSSSSSAAAGASQHPNQGGMAVAPQPPGCRMQLLHVAAPSRRPALQHPALLPSLLNTPPPPTLAGTPRGGPSPSGTPSLTRPPTASPGAATPSLGTPTFSRRAWAAPAMRSGSSRQAKAQPRARGQGGPLLQQKAAGLWGSHPNHCLAPGPAWKQYQAGSRATSPLCQLVAEAPTPTLCLPPAAVHVCGHQCNHRVGRSGGALQV